MDNAEVGSHLKVNYSFCVGLMDLVDHHDDLQPCPFLNVGLHISHDFEFYRIIDVAINMNCDLLPFPYFPFHQKLLYPFH